MTNDETAGVQGRMIDEVFTYKELVAILRLVDSKAKKLERQNKDFVPDPGKKDRSKIASGLARQLALKIEKMLERG